MSDEEIAGGKEKHLDFIFHCKIFRFFFVCFSFWIRIFSSIFEISQRGSFVFPRGPYSLQWGPVYSLLTRCALYYSSMANIRGALCPDLPFKKNAWAGRMNKNKKMIKSLWPISARDFSCVYHPFLFYFLIPFRFWYRFTFFWYYFDYYCF